MGEPAKNSEQAQINGEPWHLALFRKSVLKQRKLRELVAASGETGGKSCLDLGSDNGVISYFLRQRGGQWSSADLSEHAVSSIRSLVGERVSLIDGQSLPYPDASFELVVVVDMLEHVEDDRRLIEELHRILKPGGRLVLNIPNLKPLSPLRAFRHLIGQTDEAHGHLRPGYSVGDVERVTDNLFSLDSTHTYSRFFSELIDTLIVFAVSLLSGGHQEEGEVSKGLVVTESDIKKFEKKFKLYSTIYPLINAFSKLDLAIPFIPGFMRLGVLTRSGD